MSFGANFLGISPYLNLWVKDVMAQQNMQRQLDLMRQEAEMKRQEQAAREQAIWNDINRIQNMGFLGDAGDLYSAFGYFPGADITGLFNAAQGAISSNLQFPVTAAKVYQELERSKTLNKSAELQEKINEYKLNKLTKSDVGLSQIASGVVSMLKKYKLGDSNLYRGLMEAAKNGNIDAISNAMQLLKIIKGIEQDDRKLSILSARGLGTTSGFTASKYINQLVANTRKWADNSIKQYSSKKSTDTGVPSTAFARPIKIALAQITGEVNAPGTNKITEPINEFVVNMRKAFNSIGEGKEAVSKKTLLRMKTWDKFMDVLGNYPSLKRQLDGATSNLVMVLARARALSELLKQGVDVSKVNDAVINEISKRYIGDAEKVKKSFRWDVLFSPKSPFIDALVLLQGTKAYDMLRELGYYSHSFWWRVENGDTE